MGHFLPFHSLENPKNQDFEKMEKITGNIVILHMCTKNHNHMMYSSSDTEWDRHKFLSFWAILSPFTPLMTQQIKILKKWKKHLEMSSFYTCVPKLTTMWYMLPEMWSVADNFLSLWAIFCPFTPLANHKIEILKKWKKSLEILSFYTFVP